MAKISLGLGLVALLAAGLFATTRCAAATPATSPVLTTDKLPEPPMQHADWAAPKSHLPDDLISATTRLFQQGLADPRGCEYRNIRVRVGDKLRGDAGLKECHGWVLPQEGKDVQRFAVCWNGLVYPTDWVGDKANIAEDVDISIHRDDELEEPFCQENFTGIGGSPGTRSFNCMASEHATISQVHMLPIRVCLLARLGEARLAEKFWTAWAAKDSEKCDRYKLVSIALEWSMYDCALNARLRGDDKLSIIYLEKVHQLEKLIIDEAAVNNVEFDFGLEFHRCLDAVPSLIVDERRRISLGSHLLALEKGRSAFTTQREWIDALVDDMDRISGMDEQRDFSQDPVARALIDAGDDAVEPLLDCYEHDARPTSAGRPPMPVQEAACNVLKHILHVERFGPELRFDATHTPEQQHEQEVQLARNFWSRVKGVSNEQRDLLILADDELSSSDWYASVDKIIAAVDRRRADPAADKAATAKLASDLINTVDRLVESLNKRQENGEPWTLLNKISDWDNTAALPLLRKQVDYLRSTAFMDDTGSQLASMAVAMARAGDSSGLQVYGNWLRKFTLTDRCSEEILSPLYLFQDDPAMSATADAVFNGLRGPVNFISTNDELIDTPLLGIIGFRQQVLRALDDKRLFATVTVRVNHKFDFVGSNGTLDTNPGVGQLPLAATRLGPLDVPMTIRKCDRYAKLIGAAGGPEMQYYWPEADRDAAVADCKAFLIHYGPRLRYSPGYGGHTYPSYMYQVTYPVLDHVASKQETDSMQAIFSLEGQGERHLVKMHLPALGNWVTLKKHPTVEVESVHDGVKFTEHFANRCWVWQAEEVKVNGVWKRYYGVTGPYEIAKVPAEEIEFDSPWLGEPSEVSLAGGTDIHLVPPGSWSDNDLHYVAGFSNPLIVRIGIHNRGGVPLELPSQILITLAKNKVAIRPGITMTLHRTGEPGSILVDRNPKLATVVSARKMQPLSADQLNKHQILESNAILDDIQFDLCDCFDITRPGFYRLQVTFSKDSGWGEATIPAVEFELK